jgi:hypothetical protein
MNRPTGRSIPLQLTRFLCRRLIGIEIKGGSLQIQQLDGDRHHDAIAAPPLSAAAGRENIIKGKQKKNSSPSKMNRGDWLCSVNFFFLDVNKRATGLTMGFTSETGSRVRVFVRLQMCRWWPPFPPPSIIFFVSTSSVSVRLLLSGKPR